MVAKPVAGASTLNENDAEANLRVALARMKSAMDRHAAVVEVMSRIGVSPQNRRLAQAESKKVDHDLRDARRLLREVQSLARK
ncbi:MAG: hypothetical protein JF626_09710 [Polaromonas sp.]|nr:hypothetical protein [Polaromonas sp.]